MKKEHKVEMHGTDVWIDINQIEKYGNVWYNIYIQ